MGGVHGVHPILPFLTLLGVRNGGPGQPMSTLSIRAADCSCIPQIRVPEALADGRQGLARLVHQGRVGVEIVEALVRQPRPREVSLEVPRGVPSVERRPQGRREDEVQVLPALAHIEAMLVLGDLVTPQGPLPPWLPGGWCACPAPSRLAQRVGPALQGVADRDSPEVRSDVLPSQGEELTLPHPRGEDHGVQRGVSVRRDVLLRVAGQRG
jgi:hypothetical protein